LINQAPTKPQLIEKLRGTAIKKCYVSDYRFSEDLDFTLAEEIPFEIIQEKLALAFDYTHQASSIRLHFSRQDRHSYENSYTFPVKKLLV